MDQALVEFLRRTTAITALVGMNIEWGLRPQGAALPALGLTTVSGVPEASDEGDSGLSQSRVQIDCWAASRTAAKALAKVVKRSLSGVRIEAVTSLLEGVWTDNEVDLGPEVVAGVPIFRVAVDFQINHID